MLIKRFLFSLLYLISIYTACAQDVSTFFIDMPDEYLPQLEDAWRKDLVGLYQAGKPAVMDNTMEGRSTLQKMTSDYMYLQISERSTLEIKLLPLINRTYVACVITTVLAPVPDSRVEFFTMDWHPLEATELWKPDDKYAFIKDDVDRDDQNYQNILSFLDMELINYQLDPDQSILKATYTSPDFLSLTERERLKPFLKESPLVYQWKSGRFEP
ncbi:MAG: DUF3256 family protein [Tannerella sp.]|jgi:hypothetical protein|nr:DUF3256 family protein [Tannerella sp.]